MSEPPPGDPPPLPPASGPAIPPAPGSEQHLPLPPRPRRPRPATWTLPDIALVSAVTALSLGLAALLSARYPDDIPGEVGRTFPLVLITLIIQASLMLAGMLIVGRVWRRHPWAVFGLRPTRWWWLVVAAPLAALIILPIRLAIGLIVQLLIDPSLRIASAMQDTLFPDVSLAGGLLLILAGGLIIPFVEELFFRGMVFGWLRQRMGLWAAALLSGLVFGLAHFYPPTTVSAFMLGVVLALIYEHSGSLWPAVAIHAVNNTLIFVLTFVVMALSRLLGLPLT
ncbi:MAG: hypothetical protein Kow00124_23390 [Anaerolineae bacterium]